MLSEKQFRERAKSELREIGNQVLALTSDRDIYWKFEIEIVQANPQLAEARSEFLDMLRACYVDALTVRVLRVLDGEEGGVSLPRVLAQLAEYPELLQDKITETEFAEDRGALERSAANLRKLAAPHVGHHERTLSALAAVNRELDTAIAGMIEAVETYYWIVTESYIDLEVKYSHNPLAIFEFPWCSPVLTN